jgi:hypothetical protein
MQHPQKVIQHHVVNRKDVKINSRNLKRNSKFNLPSYRHLTDDFFLFRRGEDFIRSESDRS